MLHLAAMSITAVRPVHCNRVTLFADPRYYQVIGAFAAPISINNLLTYLEQGGQGATVKPWFWIALFFSGRVFKSVSDQWFMFMHVRSRFRSAAHASSPRYLSRLVSRSASKPSSPSLSSSTLCVSE